MICSPSNNVSFDITVFKNEGTMVCKLYWPEELLLSPMIMILQEQYMLCIYGFGLVYMLEL